ncbi:MAG: ATP-grasp domain-containing protein [Eubacterium coprostanoligenes]|nr:ATP-grasp domain-containing protein [Eubacterium coprostanoligenes]
MSRILLTTTGAVASDIVIKELKKMNELNILLTSVGRRSYLVKYFKNELNGIGKVFVSNSSDLSPAFQVADDYVVTPLIYDDNYIPFLLNYCKINNITVIISLFDIDLPILSKNKKLFEENGINVIVSDYEVIEKCNDKYLTYKFLVNNGLNAPKTYTDINQARNDLRNKKLDFPLFVKPRWGMGSISVYSADNMEELEVFYNKVKRELCNSYLKYESAIDIDNAVLIQEKLNGQEYGLDIINDLNGDYQNTIIKKKIAMRSGETDCAITVENEKLNRLGKLLSNLLKHVANLDVDVFLIDGHPFILEMNARFGGGYPFSHMAGVNLPKAIIKWLMGENLETDILKDEINVLSQKDINLVYLNSYNEIKYKDATGDEIYRALECLQDDIKPTLNERNINIRSYANKLASNGVAFIALDNEKIVGIISGYVNCDNAYVSIFIVKEGYRGKSIGKHLLNYFQNKATQNDVQILKLEVRKINTNAIGFYNHFGFNITKEATEESYYMEKSLIN